MSHEISVMKGFNCWFDALSRTIEESGNWVPVSREVFIADKTQREKRIKAVIKKASKKTLWISGFLALPPGFLGVATIIPDLVAVWKIQAQMVADIAGICGKQHQIPREAIIFCLFRQMGINVVGDLAVKKGTEFLIKKVSVRTIRQIMRKVGIKISNKVISRTVSGMIPVLGAGGIGTWSYFETKAVGLNALKLFDRPDYNLLEAG